MAKLSNRYERMSKVYLKMSAIDAWFVRAVQRGASILTEAVAELACITLTRGLGKSEGLW